MDNKKHILTIEFDNQKALEHFAHWLDEQGEQDYWTWMEGVEQEQEGDITVKEFDYWNKKDKFIGDNTIRTTCGRITKA